MSIQVSGTVSWITRGERATLTFSCLTLPLPSGIDARAYKVAFGTSHDVAASLSLTTAGGRVTCSGGVVSVTLTTSETTALTVSTTTGETKWAVSLTRTDSGYERLLVRDFVSVRNATGLFS